MTRTVYCQRLKQELPGLDAPPFPGAKGQEVFENVSAKAWQDWQNMQTMLINEKHLSLADADARSYLKGEMEKFLFGGDYDKVEGYVPE